MIADLEPYPEFKESGPPWLGRVPLLEEGGIEAFIRHFYKPQPLRTLEEIAADILAIEKDPEPLLGDIIGGRRAA